MYSAAVFQVQVLHGEPVHHVKHLILFYRITFEMFQTFCYLYMIGLMSVNNCCIRVPLLSQ